MHFPYQEIYIAIFGFKKACSQVGQPNSELYCNTVFKTWLFHQGSSFSTEPDLWSFPRLEQNGRSLASFNTWCCLQWPTQFRVSLDANTWVWHHGLATSLSTEALHEWVPVSVNERDISNPSVLSESDLFPGSCVLTRVLSLVRPGTPSSPAQEVSREYLINLRRVELCAGLPGYQFR